MRTLAGFVFLVTAFAQEPNVVSGTVQQALTGEPLPKVSLTLRENTAGKALSVTSDAEGKFEFKNVADGTYSLWGEKAGYLRAMYGARSLNSPGTTLTVKAGGVKALTMKMTPQAVIIGRVVNEDGEPLEYVMVQLGVKRGENISPMNGTQSNDLGEFRISGLDGGKYYLIASKPMRSMAVNTYVPTYYPSATDPAGAVAIEVKAGMETPRQQITLRKGQGFAVRGKVVGKPANDPSMIVMLMPRREPGRGISVSMGGGGPIKSDGSFEILNAMPGNYELVLQGGAGRQMALARVPVTVAQTDVEDLILTAQPAVSVRGVIKFDGETKASLEGLRLQMMSTDMAMGFADTAVAKDGTFQFNEVSRAKYLLSRLNLPDVYYKQVLVGGQDVTAAGPDFTNGGGEMEIVLGTKPAKLSGMVEREKAEQATGMVLIRPLDFDFSQEEPRMPTFQNVATADQNGNFSFTALPPGKYKLIALEEYQYRQMLTAAVVKRIEGRFATVELKEGENPAVRVKQISAKELAEP